MPGSRRQRISEAETDEAFQARGARATDQSNDNTDVVGFDTSLSEKSRHQTHGDSQRCQHYQRDVDADHHRASIVVYVHGHVDNSTALEISQVLSILEALKFLPENSW